MRGKTGSAVEGALVREAGWGRISFEGAVAVDVRADGSTRVISMPGRPSQRWWRPPVRNRTCGPVVVGSGHRHADRVNRGYRWWLDTKPGWVDPGRYTAPLCPQVQRLTTLDPGPELLAALTALTWNPDGSCPADHGGEFGIAGLGVGRPGFPCACLVVAAAAWEAFTSWSAQHAGTALVQAAGDTEVVVEQDVDLNRPPIVDAAREDLAVALRISPDSARGRIATARRVHRLPVLVHLVESGAVSQVTGKLLAAELGNVVLPAAQAITRVLADKIRDRQERGLRPWGVRELRAEVNKQKALLPDEELLATREQAKADRYVRVRDEADGMATVSATIPEVDAHRIYLRLTAIANGLDGDDDSRTIDQKRADVFVDLLLNPTTRSSDAGAATVTSLDEDGARAGAGHCGGGCGSDVTVNVVITLATLLGLVNDPGHVDGVGSVPAEVARGLAADGKWRAWVTDTLSGLVIGTSPGTYRPGPGLRRLVEAREPSCRYPGCRRASARCDIDHTLEFPAGATKPHNLGPLCRRHHVLKTHHDYDLTGPPDEDAGPYGAVEGWTWTTPTGITIADEPDPPLR